MSTSTTSLNKKIHDALATLDDNVFYGLADQVDKWDYIVFRRSNTVAMNNRAGKSVYYTVAVVRENFIPDGLDDSVRAAVCAIPGMKVTSSPVEYAYTEKPSTNTVVEIMTMTFVKAVSRLG